MVKKKGNFVASVIALTIGIMVIIFNSLIFNGVALGILRDLADYRFGHLLVSSNEGNLQTSNSQLLNYIQSFPYVDAAAPRLSDIASMNSTDGGSRNQVDKVQIIGIDPNRDPYASRLYETVKEGAFVSTDNTIVLGSKVAEDLKAAPGSLVRVETTDSNGKRVVERFTVVGISTSPGGLAFDDSAIFTIDSVRRLTAKPGETNQILVRLNEPEAASDLKSKLLEAYSTRNLKVQTIEEAGEETLSGIRSGIAFINLVGYFGMLSASFAIVTIMMLMVSSKTRDIGIIRAIGAKRKDILIVFLFQGFIIGCIAAIVGFATGTALGLYLSSIEFSFGPGLILEVVYDPVFTLQSSLFAILLGTAAAAYPAYRGSKLEPVDAMRPI